MTPNKFGIEGVSSGDKSSQRSHRAAGSARRWRINHPWSAQEQTGA